MSKHDIYAITEEIKRYYREEDFEAAAELADEVDWQKVKNWDTFAIMTDIYENLGEYENARDMSILAYNRNLGGKKLVYRLTELLIKTGDLDEAEETFNEYCQMSNNAPDSYILEYHLLREKGAPDQELIRVLEEFKEAGPDERYMYRLAELYAKNGENEKCAEICDNIALWFKDGDFAEGAVKLKKKVGAALSPEQEKLFNTATVKEEDLKKTSKVDFKGQIDPGVHAKETAGDAGSKVGKGAAATAAGAAAGGAVASGAAGKIKNLVKNVFNDEDFDEGLTGEVPVAEVNAAADAAGAGAAAAAGAAGAAVAAGAVGAAAAAKAASGAADAKAAGRGGVVAAGAETADEASVKHDIDPEIKKNLSAEVKDELKTESALRGDGVYDGEKPMDGQVNMNDWMTDVREKKGQSTKEYSKDELDRILEEKDIKSKAYDRLMAEQKKLAETSGKPFDEASAKRKVELQLAVDAARRDLDIRTGKGAVRQESAVGAAGAAVAGAVTAGAAVAGAATRAEGSGGKKAGGVFLTEETARQAVENKQQIQGQTSGVSAHEEAIHEKSIHEEAIQDEVILGAVLDAAGTEAEKERGGSETDSSERLNRIECAVLSVLGVDISEQDKAIGNEAPKEVADAAALLVAYISGKLSSSEAPASSADHAKDDTAKNNRSAKEKSRLTEEKAPGKEEQNVRRTLAQTAEKETDSEKPATSDATATVAATAAAGTAAVAGGVLHEKAQKAKEIFDGEKTEEPETVTAAKEEMKPHELEALKEIQGTKITGSATEAVKEARTAEKESKEKAVRAARKAGKTTDERSSEEKTYPEDAKIDVKKEISDIPSDKSAEVSAERSDSGIVDKSVKKDKKTGKPDIGKMRVKDVTDEHIVATLTAEEAKVAESKMTQDEAADVIQKRITAPLDTAAVASAVAAASAASAAENADINIKDEDTFTDTAHIDKKMLREIIESSENDEEAEGKSTRRFDTTSKQDTAQLDNVLREDMPRGKREKIKAMFDEYYDLPEIDAQIEEYIAALPVEITREDSRNGNIIIAGSESVDKTALAKTIAKAVNISYPKKKKKIIRTTGENLNRYGFARSADKLRGTFLVIENAGRIIPEVIDEIVSVMVKNTDRMIVIAEDTDAGIESFMNMNPALPKLFNHRINMRPFTTDELVEIAKELAGQKGFSIDDEGALALYLEIEELRNSEPKVSIDDMDALTDDAIAHARKRIKRETGVNPKRQDESICVLTNEDFRY